MAVKVTFLFALFLSAVPAALLTVAAQPATKSPDLKLWFSKPAQNWNEALPVGNGKLGAMIFGGITSERFQLNEQTVWTGKDTDFVNPKAKAALPQVRQLLFSKKYKAAEELARAALMGNKTVESNYQTLGDLLLDFSLPAATPSAYRRELDIGNAVAKVAFKAGAVSYTREIFSSAPANALFIRLTADRVNALTFTAKLTRPGGKATTSIAGNEVLMTEHAGNGVGVKLAARLKVITQGGKVSSTDTALSIENATSVLLVLTAATDYWGDDPAALSAKWLRLAASKSYESLKTAHVADYRRYFNRVALDLGKNDSLNSLPVNERLLAFQKGAADAGLINLYYQFGRYLLISSSRPGGLPANLQGIWADGLTPPWSADYHININIQMNYWPAEVTNLPELHLPFLQFLQSLVPDGKKTARDMYGLNGAVAHFTTDPWRFTETYGQPQWAMWPMGLAWSTRHLWDHYLFTGDKKFLAATAYPVLKEAALFCSEWLVENPADSLLVSGPSISPENTFKTSGGEVATMVMGPTMDHMIIRDLFTNTIQAGEVLGKDADFTSRLKTQLRQLSPTRIGSDGRIMEWTEEFEEPEPGHRHISPLYGLHPGNEINPQTPELLEAARKTIEKRLANGGGHTGWSRAWIINFFARLHDGESAYKNLQALLQKSTLPNLFDNHPPFQIDGNFGAVAGITEMLLQSHAGELELLPALPAAWPTGSISGIMARGGFEVSMHWSRGQLEGLTLLSKLGNNCRVRYGDKVIELTTQKGKRYFFDGDLRRQYL